MQLLPAPLKSEEEQVRELVDATYYAWKHYKHVRTTRSLYHFVKLIQQLEVWGYTIQLEHTKRTLVAINTRRCGNAAGLKRYERSEP